MSRPCAMHTFVAAERPWLLCDDCGDMIEGGGLRCVDCARSICEGCWERPARAPQASPGLARAAAELATTGGVWVVWNTGAIALVSVDRYAELRATDRDIAGVRFLASSALKLVAEVRARLGKTLGTTRIPAA